MDELVDPNPRHGLTEGGNKADPNPRITLHENEPNEPDEHVARVPGADGAQGCQCRVHPSPGDEVVVRGVHFDAHGGKANTGEETHEQQEGPQEDGFIG